ncbi:hypothetical protein FNV43_RR00825 [Rhamnella rubrinervis]|uniref:TMV resistance protein N-like n=1 Tax=Rhamnella rubrinervis TaxID=2594499 RepID=A0A8K0HPC4_9ROSA|nr:hypothetical protein FNV43_RR00825 [Rhamnella rubrinervis]
MEVPKDPIATLMEVLVKHSRGMNKFLVTTHQRNQAKFIEDFIKVVSSKLDVALLNISKELVGMDSRLEELKLCVSRSPFEDVRFIGICGMGASSFLANIREVCEKENNGLLKLQKQLLTDILKGEHTINNVYEGIGMIRTRLCSKKVLVILDDVDQLKQLEGLAEKNSWFGYGSRIILTTRDESLLTIMYGEEEYILHNVDKLKYSEALGLFSSKAFKSDCSPEDYRELSEKVLKYANGLPLALVVLGSFLRRKNINEWRSALDRLKEYPKEEIMKVLQISFDGLEETEKKIFLDIACFFNGSPKNYIMKIMDSCGFFPEIGIRSLVDKSLLQMDHNDKLRMHDLLEEMGKEIIRKEPRYEPGRRSRIWLSEDFYHVMNNDTGTEEVEAIAFHDIIPGDLSLRGFSKMKKLRLLITYSTDLFGLKRDEEIDPSISVLKRLTVLSLVGCERLKCLPRSMDGLESLKALKLSHCSNLEGLDVTDTDITCIPSSIGHLKALKSRSHGWKSILNTIGGYGLSSVGLYSLEELDLSNCGLRDGSFRDDFGCLVSLEYLDLSDNYFSCLPAHFNQLSKLRDLVLSRCRYLTSLGPELPDSLESVRVDFCTKLRNFLDPLSQCNLRCSMIF